MDNKISIIIPFYNTKLEYLRQCIDSALNQTYKNIEIIIINDGSLPMYDDFLDQYKNKIQIIKTKNYGVSYARNKGIEVAAGKWIIFLDSDDFLESNACEKYFKNIMQHNQPDIIISKVYIHDFDKTYENICYNDIDHKIKDKDELIESIFLNENNKYSCVDTPWAKLYSKKFLIENDIKFDNNLTNGEDGLFNFISYCKANKIYFIQDKTYNYRINSFSNCKTYKDDLNIKFANLLGAYKNLFEGKNIILYDKMLSLYALRILCRLIRKYYSHCENYSDFKLKFNNTNDIFEELIDKIKLSDYTGNKKIVLILYKFKLDYLLFLLSKSKIKIK